ncbi:MAG: hypothetical protein ACKOTZ_02055 [Chloroflexota bacterium]
MTAARGSRVALLALGTPGGGPELFAQGWPTGRTRLEVRARGVTVPPTAWRAFLPGPLDAHHGLRDHAVALTFDARAASRVVDGKTIAVRLRYHASHGPQPALEVRLNGVGAWLHPQVVRDDRREVYMPTPIAGVVDRVLVLPGALLRPTGNRLEIVSRTPDPGPRPDAVAPGTRRGWHGALFGSGLEWDHLEVALTEDAVLPTHAEIAVSPLQPRGPDGRAMTRIEVLLTGPGPLPASTRLHVAGRGEPVELPLPDGHPARGDVRWLVDLPALTGPTEVRLVTDPEDGRPPLELVRTLHPARPWVVHVIPHVHLDVGYTDAQGAVVEIHARNLDRLLGMTDGEMGYRFAIDGSLVVEQFLATRHPAGGEALLARLRDGRIDVNAYQALFLAGIVSHEELYRATTYAFELAARTGAPVEYANLTDVPAYPTSLPTALASLGIGSFLGIQNHFRASTATSDTLHLASPFRWQGPDGSEVVTFLADQYGQVRWLAGDPPGVAGLEDGLTRFIRRFDRPNHVPDDLPLIGIAADNEDIGDGDRELVGAWNARYAFPRLEWSTPRRYFAQVAAHRADLPVIAGDGGSWWEDGLGAAAAAVARYRRAQEALLAADGLAALVTPAAAQLTAPHAALRAGWDALLLGAEHTWTSAHATAHPESEQTHDQLAWKVRQIDAAAEAGQFEQGRILGQLAELIGREAPFVATVNLASWTRDIPVEVELRPDEELREAGRPLREVVLWDDGGRRRVRTAVRGVPPFGYRTIEVAVRAVSRIRRRRIARRPRCSAEVDPVTGYVHHLADGSGRELLDPARGAGLGQVLHVAGGGDRIGRGIADATMLLDRTPPRPEPRLTVTPSVVTSVEQIDDADGRTIRTLATAPAMPEIRTEVLLPARGDRVRVTVTIEKVPELAKESVMSPSRSGRACHGSGMPGRWASSTPPGITSPVPATTGSASATGPRSRTRSTGARSPGRAPTRRSSSWATLCAVRGRRTSGRTASSSPG